MTTKEALRQLSRLFSSTPSSATSPTDSFPSNGLPSEVTAALDEQIRTFAASFPSSAPGGSTTAGQSEGERERTRWREGLLEIWTSVEPLPGTERELHNIARVSAFLVLLDKLSADVGDDDDSALISRRDIGSVWWNAVLRRTMLGTARESEGDAAATKAPQGRGRKPERKGKDPVALHSGTAMLPLYVSRQALSAATRMIVWGMAAPRDRVDASDEWVSPFGVVILNEYEDRALARLKGLDEGYGIRNLEECLISWGSSSPKAFFARMATFLNPSVPALLPSVSLLLAFLARNSAKSYHALATPLVGNLVTVALTVSCHAIVTLSIKTLVIFVVALPVIIGEQLFGIMAVYGRAVSWEPSFDLDEEVQQSGAFSADDIHGFLDEYEDSLPDPTTLFTALYGIYPCNFSAFLRDPVDYLRGKKWPGALGDGVIDLSSVSVRSRSEPIMRGHTLHPALFNGDAETELTDTKRWARLEAADVMAACDRNVAQVHFETAYDWRGMPSSALAEDERRSFRPSTQLANSQPLDSTVPTPKPASPDNSRPLSRAVSRARSATPSSVTAGSPARVSTPHMPATTHFANFQALQSFSSPSLSPARRSGSRFRHASDEQGGDPMAWSGTLDLANAPPSLPASMSRRSSGVTSHGTGGGLLSPELLPVGASSAASSARGARSAVSPPPTPAQVGALLVKLETELVLLQGEVNFQSYLKQLHLQHMGTLHREKVLESGAEAERQSSFRTIRTLRAQLKATQLALDQLRAEQAATKANWTSHIVDLRDKLSGLREHRMRWDHVEKELRAELEDWKDRCGKKERELAEEGASLMNLRNQVTLDARKIARIGEYENRIEALTKTLAICDADLVKFVEQRKEMNLLVGEWKKADLLRASVEHEVAQLKAALRTMEANLVEARRQAASRGATLAAGFDTHPDSRLGELAQLRRELDRLRARNLELEERLADALDDDDDHALGQEGSRAESAAPGLNKTAVQ